MQNSVKVFINVKSFILSVLVFVEAAVEVCHHGSRTNVLVATPWLDSLPYTFHAKQRSQLSPDQYIPIRKWSAPDWST